MGISPSFLYKAIDSFGTNHLFGFIYTHYINTLGLSGNKNILDFGSGSGAGSKHLAKLIQNKDGPLTCLDTSIYWTSVAKRRLHHEDYQTVHDMGWRRIVIWECELKKSYRDKTLEHLLNELNYDCISG